LGKKERPFDPDLIGKYLAKGHITHGGAQSNGGIYSLNVSEDPLVAFGADSCGPFSSPRGSIMLIDKTALNEFVTNGSSIREMEEVIFEEKVPLSKISALFVHKNDAGPIAEKYGKSTGFAKSMDKLLHSHNYSSLEQFRREGLVEIIKFALQDQTVLSQPKYRSSEALERLTEAEKLSRDFASQIGKWHNTVKVLTYNFNFMTGSGSIHLTVPSVPLLCCGKRAVLNSLDDRIKQVNYAISSFQRKIPEAYKELDAYAAKLVSQVEGAKTALRAREAKIVGPFGSYFGKTVEAEFREFPPGILMSEQMNKIFTESLIKEIKLLEQKYCTK
jgi:hypothetical protein